MIRSLSKSNAHFKKALTRLPLGVSSQFRYWGDDKTIDAASGEGARLTDIDGSAGVPELFDVKNDLCTFANAMGDGYSISAVCSREDIMRKFGDDVVLSGLFFDEHLPCSYRDRGNSDYTFYEAEAYDQRCLAETLQRFEIAVDRVVTRAQGPGAAQGTSRQYLS